MNYCLRFYDRQFITREHLNKDILVRFEELLTGYFDTEKPHTLGLPTVGYCADSLNLSANYFGELIKKETGQSAQEYIQSKVIDLAKEQVIDRSPSATCRLRWVSNTPSISPGCSNSTSGSHPAITVHLTTTPTGAPTRC